MKIIYISLSIGTCYLIFVKFKATYDGNHDSMRAEFLVVPALGLACLINTSFDVMEVLWTFSIYLESVAILPQLFMISKVNFNFLITHFLEGILMEHMKPFCSIESWLTFLSLCSIRIPSRK